MFFFLWLDILQPKELGKAWCVMCKCICHCSVLLFTHHKSDHLGLQVWWFRGDFTTTNEFFFKQCRWQGLISCQMDRQNIKSYKTLGQSENFFLLLVVFLPVQLQYKLSNPDSKIFRMLFITDLNWFIIYCLKFCNLV